MTAPRIGIIGGSGLYDMAELGDRDQRAGDAHQRKPLATAALVLVAISFIFGPLRSVTMGQRIFTGVVLGIVFVLLQKLLGPSSLVFGFPPLIAVLFPIALCIALGMYLLNKAR